MLIYNPKKLEKKWREQWKKERIYQPSLKAASLKPYYNLMMFPYPSAEGLHVGNMYAFTGADVWGRFKRMQGFDVFEPIGLDGFGIHSENYAIKAGKHPAEQAKRSEANFYRQLEMIGNGFAWENRLETYDPDYYKWTQWIFIKLYEQGLVYRKKAPVNWCPGCKTVLADEQVINELCERCDTPVEMKELEQWFFRITKYADRLLKNLDEIDWDRIVTVAQRNWIGRSRGHEIKFEIRKAKLQSLEVFTTRLDTINGVTFIALSPDHAQAKELKGKKAINPANGREVPIVVADYVLGQYGTGVVMGVPADDERDKVFAKKHKLPIVSSKTPKRLQEKLIREGVARVKVNYHLRDWLISRQRYWGPPIPMTYCKACAGKVGPKKVGPSNRRSNLNRGWFPVAEKDLPVKLPDLKDFKPSGDGKSPLEKASEAWLYTKCPECGGKAKRETDVSDTFLDSAWYFLRYPSLEAVQPPGGTQIGIDDKGSTRRVERAWDPEITKKWLPVDMYIGGAEHAVLHLLYSRFLTMALHDMGWLEFEEPFLKFRAHGLIIKDGAKMSKSKGNVINPDEYIDRYGADTLRTYLMFVGPLEKGGDFRDTAMAGTYRFLERFWQTFREEISKSKSQKYKYIGGKSDPELQKKLHWAIKRVTESIKRLKYNTAIAAVMELVNTWRSKRGQLSREDAQVVVKLLAPFAPFICEELWQGLGGEGSVHKALWPEWDSGLLKEDSVLIIIQVNGKMRSRLQMTNNELQMTNAEELVIKMAKEDKGAAKWLEGKKIKKQIWVKPRGNGQGIVNFVV